MAEKKLNKEQTLNVFFAENTSQDWLGGLNYYTNLFTALQKIENPKIKPYILKQGNQASNILYKYAEILNVKKTLYYYFIKKILFPILHKDFDIRRYAVKHTSVKIDAVSHSDAEINLPRILWIADFQHLHLPQMFTQVQLDERNKKLRKAVEESETVILSSNDAFNDFKKIYPEFSEKCEILNFVAIPQENIYSITDEIAGATKEKYNLPEKYFYVPNQFWKHKNHKIVLEAISILKQQNINVHVVFSGNTNDVRNPGYFDELLQFIKDKNIIENIHILGIIERNELFVLLRNCVSLINPSLFEGWSSTVEEAKSIGKNCILSDLSVHREQNPPDSVYFDVNDSNALAEIMAKNWQERTGGSDFLLEQEAKKHLLERIKNFGLKYQQILLKTLNRRKLYEKSDDNILE